MKKTKSTIPIIMLSANQSIPENAADWVDVFVTKGDSPRIWLDALAEALQHSAKHVTYRPKIPRRATA
jgi:hypothetical protein